MKSPVTIALGLSIIVGGCSLLVSTSGLTRRDVGTDSPIPSGDAGLDDGSGLTGDGSGGGDGDAAALPLPNPVAAYSFDQQDGGAGAGGAAGEDNSGNGNTITFTNVLAVEGHFGGAAGFNGTTSIGRVVASPSTADLGPATWTMWIHRGDHGTLLYKSDDNESRGYWLSIDDSYVELKVVRSDSNYTFRSATLPAPNTWFHLAMVWDGKLEETSVNLFIDGQPAARDVSQGNGQHDKDDTVPLFIGSSDGKEGGHGVFNGRIDNLRIYRHALTVAQIRADMVLPVPHP